MGFYALQTINLLWQNIYSIRSGMIFTIFVTGMAKLNFTSFFFKRGKQ